MELTLNNIAKELKKQVHRWYEISEGKLRLKYREPHPADHISKLLHQAYMKFPLPLRLQQLCQRLENKAQDVKEQAEYVADIENQDAYPIECKKYSASLSQALEDIGDLANGLCLDMSEPNIPKQSRSITLKGFLSRYCEPLPEGVLDSRIKMLQKLHRDKAIILPKIREREKGRADLYDEDKMLKKWSEYQGKMPNPILLKKTK